MASVALSTVAARRRPIPGVRCHMRKPLRFLSLFILIAASALVGCLESPSYFEKQAVYAKTNRSELGTLSSEIQILIAKLSR